MSLIFNISLPHPLPDKFFTTDELNDEDARWLKTKKIVEFYKDLIEKGIPGAEVDIEW